MTTNAISRRRERFRARRIDFNHGDGKRERENWYCRWEAKRREEEITRKVTLAEDENFVGAIADVDR